jgi:hypothetical protein
MSATLAYEIVSQVDAQVSVRDFGDLLFDLQPGE